MLKPSSYLREGYNCAESMIKCYNDEFNENIPVAIGSGMGAGACSGSLCGAINGAITIVGYLKGREDNNELNGASKYVKEIMTIVKEKYSSEICRDLKANKISCGEITDFSYETLKKVLE